MDRGLERIYTEIPARYEITNHVLTLGLDRLWRRRAARIAARRGGGRWIDLCSGTGEMAVLLKHLAGHDCTVFAADFSMPMLSRARTKPETGEILFVLSGIDALPFPDECFDLATISFATRNVDRGGETLVYAFREILRVLRPGGRFVNLETSRPRNPFVRTLFHSYVRLLVGPIGGAITGSRAGYAYLSSSIPRFHSRDRLSEILREAGFSEVESVPFFFGAAAVHTAVR
jgi:demethylmenaquinone methyltransferase/2-methoxy-6-polyprenyl-1,4-benzoquinol methylase